jgi:conserved domain protein
VSKNCVILYKNYGKDDSKMKPEEKIRLLEVRLQKLENSEKDNYGVCRRIRRDIRNLKKRI